MELRKRRGLMVALIVVTIGIPTHLPHHPLAGSRLRAAVLRAGRRIGHLQRPGGRRPLRLRFHRRRHVGLHGRVRRPHRGDVPPPGGDRPFALGALPGSDPRRPGDHRAAGGRRVHHRLLPCACSPRPPSSTTGVNVPAGLSRPAWRPGPAATPTRSICDFGSGFNPVVPEARTSMPVVLNSVPCGNGPAVEVPRSQEAPGLRVRHHVTQATRQRSAAAA